MPEDNVFIIFFVKKKKKKKKHYSVVIECNVAMYIFVHVTKCIRGRISPGHTTKDGVCGSQDVSYLF